MSAVDCWALMAEALRENEVEYGECGPEDHLRDVIVVHLPDGDVHICRGAACPHASLNEDKMYVCGLSGVIVGVSALRENYSTGREAGSADPDALAGGPLGGSWAKQKDVVQLSEQATTLAETTEAKLAEVEFIIPTRKSRKNMVKRGARCVDAPPEEGAVHVKRHRTAVKANENDDTTNRAETEPPELNIGPAAARAVVLEPDQATTATVTNRASFASLVREAENVINRLVNYEKKPEVPTCVKDVAKPRDPRLLDHAALFDLGVTRYGRECLAAGAVPTLDALHNIAIVARAIAATERKRDSVGVRARGQSALLLRVRVRELVSTLCAHLWVACCVTPYMRNERRSSDSFKPFVSGCLYALKRGIQLCNGTPVLPVSPDLASALPALRATASHSSAKALHAASHRGLCTLHRSVASCSPEQQTTIFSESAFVCSKLVAVLRERSFDVV
jgi:hypothetical protein